MSATVMSDGGLDTKSKELIASAIAVAERCDGCIASPARGAAREGATATEVHEALGVATRADPGPGTVRARAVAVFGELAVKM